MWKEVAVAQFKTTSDIYLKELRKITNTPSHESCPETYSKSVSPKYKSEALPLEFRCSVIQEFLYHSYVALRFIIAGNS